MMTPMLRTLLLILVFCCSSSVYGDGATYTFVFRGKLIGIQFANRRHDNVAVVLQFVVHEGYATRFGLDPGRLSFIVADLDVEFPLEDLSPDVYRGLLRSALPKGIELGSDCLVVADWYARRRIQELIPYSESAHRAFLTRHFDYLEKFAEQRLDAIIEWLETSPEATSTMLTFIARQLDQMPEDDEAERERLLQEGRQLRDSFGRMVPFQEQRLAQVKGRLIYLRAFAPTPDARGRIDRLLDAVARASETASALRGFEP